MVMAGSILFLAGPPDVVDQLQALNHLDDPATQAELAARESTAG